MSSVEQCCIIRFLVKEKVKPTEIPGWLTALYGEETLSCACVCDWSNKFSEGCKEVLNLPHAHIQPTDLCDMFIHHVEVLILGNGLITVSNVAVTCFAMMCTKHFRRKDLGNCQRRSSHCMTILIHLWQILQL
jgi:hypothetical protein